MIKIESIDGTAGTAADGFAQVSDMLGATTRLQPLDWAGFFDGDREIGASIQDPFLSLSSGESATASMSFDVASGPNGAIDPNAFYGAFVVDFDLSVSTGDTAIVSGRVELIPTPGAAALAVLATLTAGWWRRAC
ncbi:MAG: hypothetical protein AAGB34_01835 [Planctomycetota bacterium]